MLSRRFIRIKVMQALYAYFQSDNNELSKSEDEMIRSFNNIGDLYHWVLSLMVNIRTVALDMMTDAKSKRFPTPTDLNPNRRFVDNSFLKALSESAELNKFIDSKKQFWNNDYDIIRKIFLDIKKTEIYSNYLLMDSNKLNADKTFLYQLIDDVLSEHDLVNHFFEDKNVHWADDLFVAFVGIRKTIENFDGSKVKLQPLFRDEQEDIDFARKLFEKCIQNKNYFAELISEKTVNWEVERIAQMDVLLMKMALTEVLFFETIPVKVSLNEYIDISKEYSTPKSKVFINGVLDKIVIELKSQEKIVKKGRGLVEN
jgi:N utilization substance protein B